MNAKPVLEAYEAAKNGTPSDAIHRAGFLLGLALRPNPTLTEHDRLMLARSSSSLADYSDKVERQAAT